MAQLTAANFLSKFNALFADNTTGEISEGDMRTFTTDIKDSFLNIADGGFATALEIQTGVENAKAIAPDQFRAWVDVYLFGLTSSGDLQSPGASQDQQVIYYDDGNSQWDLKTVSSNLPGSGLTESGGELDWTGALDQDATITGASGTYAVNLGTSGDPLSNFTVYTGGGGDWVLENDGGNITMQSNGGNMLFDSDGGNMTLDSNGGTMTLDSNGGNMLLDTAGGTFTIQSDGNDILFDSQGANLYIDLDGYQMVIREGSAYAADQSPITVTGSSPTQAVDMETYQNPIIDCSTATGTVTLNATNIDNGQGGFFIILRGTSSVTLAFQADGVSADATFGDQDTADISSLLNNQYVFLGYQIYNGKIHFFNTQPIFGS